MSGHDILNLAAICFVVFGAAILLVYGIDKRWPVPPEKVYSIRDHFPKVLNDEVVTPIMDDYLMKCCDCGLVHRFRFRAVKVRKLHADGTWSYDVLDPERYRVELLAQRVDDALAHVTRGVDVGADRLELGLPAAGAQECSSCHGGYILGQRCGFCATRDDGGTQEDGHG